VLGEVPLAELGGAVLPPDATAQQRARAEAIWRPVEADQPCRCTGACSHGTPCDPDTEDPGRCTGRLIHADRYPGSVLELTVWTDEYVCDTCEQLRVGDAVVPEVPWGERTKDVTVVFDGVRHPTFADVDDDSGCFECGARPGYACTCPDPDAPYCTECGADHEYRCSC
jgi:hypothetical protein